MGGRRARAELGRLMGWRATWATWAVQGCLGVHPGLSLGVSPTGLRVPVSGQDDHLALDRTTPAELSTGQSSLRQTNCQQRRARTKRDGEQGRADDRSTPTSLVRTSSLPFELQPALLQPITTAHLFTHKADERVPDGPSHSSSRPERTEGRRLRAHRRADTRARSSSPAPPRTRVGPSYFYHTRCRRLGSSARQSDDEDFMMDVRHLPASLFSSRRSNWRDGRAHPRRLTLGAAHRHHLDSHANGARLAFR